VKSAVVAQGDPSGLVDAVMPDAPLGVAVAVGGGASMVSATAA